MCGIVGVYLPDPTDEDIALIERIILQAKVRGLHATGISYLQNGSLKTVKAPLPADRFLGQDIISLAECYDPKNNMLRLIAHCRYSTSDLEYNQPLATPYVSIAHNGVVTQEMPENWERLYGYKCETKNDSELILRTIRLGRCPLTIWQNSSLAVLELYASGKLRAYRNGKRPLYLAYYKDGVIFASTFDILSRAKLDTYPIELDCNTYYTVHDSVLDVQPIGIPGSKDLQICLTV